MNGNTLRQWDRYVRAHPELSGHEKLVLWSLVGAHDASAGVTMPGIRRVAAEAGIDAKTVTKALDALAAAGHIVLVKRWPASLRRSDEYGAPWLHNGTPEPDESYPQSRGKSPTGSRGKFPSGKSHTSSPKKEKGTTARFRGAAVVQKNTGDAPGHRDGDTQPPCPSCGSTEPNSCLDCGKAAPDAIRRILLETTGRNIDPDAITGRKKPGTSDR